MSYVNRALYGINQAESRLSLAKEGLRELSLTIDAKEKQEILDRVMLNLSKAEMEVHGTLHSIHEDTA